MRQRQPCSASSFALFLVTLLLSNVNRPYSKVLAEDADMVGRLNIMSSCDANVVNVDKMYLTCDSPGTYYYSKDQSTYYRKSSRCKYGDKGNLYVFFTINSSYAWYGVDVTIDSGAFDSFTTVLDHGDLCETGILSFYGDDDVVVDNKYCPTPGTYRLYWSFTILGGGRDTQLQYTPDIRVRFTRQDDDTTSSVLGCATSGTYTTVQAERIHAIQGEEALGLALAIFLFVFGCCLCCSYRRKKQLEEEVKGQYLRERFYYVRNPRTGEIVPVADPLNNYPLPPPNEHPYQWK